MARLVQNPPKFSHPEWHVSNQMNYGSAEGERAAAERLIEESKRLVDDTDKTTLKTQQDVDKKLDQRLTDITYWKKELEDKLDAIKVETDGLRAYTTRVEKAVEACKEPLHITQQCLINRHRRLSIELVHDDPEKELLKEVEVLQGCLALLERTREQAEEQLRINRKAKYNLEKDLKDKFMAQTIDEHNAELRNYTTDLYLKNGVTKIDGNSATPHDWEHFSNKNIFEAEKQRNNSKALRSLMDGILQSTANDMLRQKVLVDENMTRRIDETRDSKEKLEDHLSKVLKQIQEMEDNIIRLKNAIAAKEAPMRLAQTRLDNRSNRPNIELVRDAVQYRLVGEVGEIIDTVSQLQNRLAQSEDALKGLTRRELNLEEDIALKGNTLYIDETECMAMRNSISIKPF